MLSQLKENFSKCTICTYYKHLKGGLYYICLENLVLSKWVIVHWLMLYVLSYCVLGFTVCYRTQSTLTSAQLIRTFLKVEFKTFYRLHQQ